jgi:hypothetical protein
VAVAIKPLGFGSGRGGGRNVVDGTGGGAGMLSVSDGA